MKTKSFNILISDVGLICNQDKPPATAKVNIESNGRTTFSNEKNQTYLIGSSLTPKVAGRDCDIGWLR